MTLNHQIELDIKLYEIERQILQLTTKQQKLSQILDTLTTDVQNKHTTLIHHLLDHKTNPKKSRFFVRS